MKIFNRKIAPGEILSKAGMLLQTYWGLQKTCKHPLQVLKAYMRRQPPESVTLHNGLKVYLGKSKEDVSTFCVIFGRNEYGNIAGKKTIVDVGGNVGLFTMYAIFSGAQKVFVFEPNPACFEIITRNITANNLEQRVKAFPLAMSAASGQTLYINQLPRPTNFTSAFQVHQNQVAVGTISFNDFMQQEQIDHIDLLKMDCEGGEYEILPAVADAHAKAIAEIKLEYHADALPIELWLGHHGFTITHQQYFPIPKVGYLWATKNSMKATDA